MNRNICKIKNTDIWEVENANRGGGNWNWNVYFGEELREQKIDRVSNKDVLDLIDFPWKDLRMVETTNTLSIHLDSVSCKNCQHRKYLFNIE